LTRYLEAASGKPAGAVAFGTEGPFFNALGLETLILGPGSIDQAHQPDEFLSLSEIEPGVTLFENLIGRYCRA
jgi:acetylornithine deacetylase